MASTIKDHLYAIEDINRNVAVLIAAGVCNQDTAKFQEAYEALQQIDWHTGAICDIMARTKADYMTDIFGI